jgi:hypothetical protein
MLYAETNYDMPMQATEDRNNNGSDSTSLNFDDCSFKGLSIIDIFKMDGNNPYTAKILTEYRLYTDEVKNPMQAWSEMEHHSFFQLVEDYESLGGNDYVHGTILPAMNELDIIPMSDLDALKDLYNSRQVK